MRVALALGVARGVTPPEVCRPRRRAARSARARCRRWPTCGAPTCSSAIGARQEGRQSHAALHRRRPARAPPTVDRSPTYPRRELSDALGAIGVRRVTADARRVSINAQPVLAHPGHEIAETRRRGRRRCAACRCRARPAPRRWPGARRRACARSTTSANVPVRSGSTGAGAAAVGRTIACRCRWRGRDHRRRRRAAPRARGSSAARARCPARSIRSAPPLPTSSRAGTRRPAIAGPCARGSAGRAATTSSPRSRSGGTVTGTTDRRKYEILAEPALGHLGAELAVGRRDQAHVGVQRHRAADPLELAGLEHAQDLGLDRRRQLADLVEEQRAAVGQLEAARACAGPRP